MRYSPTENNAELLRSILVKISHEWKLDAAFITWMEKTCSWHNTLVDRIVTGTPDQHPLLAQDPMLAVCEPYALFAIQEVPGVKRWIDHPAVIWTNDVLPFFLRKVRILNGGHSGMVHKAIAKGYTIVRDSVNDKELGPWLEKLLYTEIVPILEGRCDDPKGFAGDHYSLIGAGKKHFCVGCHPGHSGLTPGEHKHHEVWNYKFK